MPRPKKRLSAEPPDITPILDAGGDVLLTPQTVAKYLKVTESCIRHWRWRGVGPPWIKTDSGGILYRTSALLSWERSGRRGPFSLADIDDALKLMAGLPDPARAAIISHLNAALFFVR